MRRLFLFIFVISLASATSAATIYATANGDWHNTATWAGGIIPGSGDNVVIDGYAVTITTASVSVHHLTLTNATAASTSSLVITNTLTVTVGGDLYLTANDVDQNVQLQINSNAIVNVAGKVEMSRSADNSRNKQLKLSISGSAALNVAGDFNITYSNSGSFEGNDEVELFTNAVLHVAGNANISLAGGKALKIVTYADSRFKVDQNLIVTKTGGANIEITAKSSSEIRIIGTSTLTNNGALVGNIVVKANTGSIVFESDVTMTSNALYRDVMVESEGTAAEVQFLADVSMSAINEADVWLNLRSSGSMSLAGDLLRPTNYGNLSMEDNTTFVFNGATPQTLPQAKLSGSGTDEIVFTNLEINNSSGVAFALEGPIVVDTELKLQQGIIATNTTNTLTIEDFATISGGSEASFIDGPIIKKGRTIADSLIFPIGNNGVYAPLEIDSISSASDQFTAQYFYSSPPDRNSTSSPLSHISAMEHWSFSKTAGSKNVNITLHWKDAGRSGINDISSLVIAMYNVNAPAMGWKSIGQGKFGGSAVGSNEGWITNDLLCPPPIEEGLFSFASTSALTNPLPVALLDFSASKIGEEVLIKWMTSFERDNDYFEVERSSDGMHYQVIEKVYSAGNNQSHNVYHIVDEQAVNGTNYYRLKQVDYDGNYAYSPVVIVKFYKASSALIQPNPVQDQINLMGLDVERGNVAISIFSVDGRLIYQANFEIEQRELHIPASNVLALGQGVYLLQYTTRKGAGSIKFIKE